MLHVSVKCENNVQKNQGNGNSCVRRFCDCDGNQRSCSNAVIEKAIKVITLCVYGNVPDDILGGYALCGSLQVVTTLIPKYSELVLRFTAFEPVEFHVEQLEETDDNSIVDIFCCC